MKIVVMSVLLFLAGCPLKSPDTKKVVVKDLDAAYDVPPPPPIPPETYCYELREGDNGSDVTTLQLTIMGDSAFGHLHAHIGKSNDAKGYLTGTLYAKTLLATYTAGNNKPEDQEWKVLGDTVYRKITEAILPDATEKNPVDSVRITKYPLLLKVPCK